MGNVLFQNHHFRIKAGSIGQLFESFKIFSARTAFIEASNAWQRERLSPGSREPRQSARKWARIDQRLTAKEIGSLKQPSGSARMAFSEQARITIEGFPNHHQPAWEQISRARMI